MLTRPFRSSVAAAAAIKNAGLQRSTGAWNARGWSPSSLNVPELPQIYLQVLRSVLAFEKLTGEGGGATAGLPTTPADEIHLQFSIANAKLMLPLSVAFRVSWPGSSFLRLLLRKNLTPCRCRW